MKKIPRSNYIIVAVISTLTFVIVGYFAFWYTETRGYNNSDSVMSGYLLEIGEEELIVNLTNYILDNPNTVLYMSYNSDSTNKVFETEFKNFIADNNIKQSFIYIDLNKVDDKNFISDFQANFFSDNLKKQNVKLKKQPNLFIFKDGKVESSLYYTNQPINMFDVKIYLQNQEVIDND